jgi:iron complex outermembrane recepter protein
MSLYFRGCLSAASALALGAGLAQSQQRLDTVIVTTVGPEHSADELINNAAALDREEIVERLSSSLGDTLENQPGVSSTAFGQRASRPVLRGLGAERVQVLTNGIGVIDASAASPDHQVSADGIDAERIEILRGPAALAYGGQAIGGVVNVIDGLIVAELPEEPISAEGLAAWNSVNEGPELAGRFRGAAGPFVLTLSASARDFDNYDIPGFAESAFQMAAEEAEEEDHDEDHDHEEEEEQRGTLENSFVGTQTLAAGLSWGGEGAFFGVAIRQQTAEYGLPGHSHEHGEEHEGEERNSSSRRATSTIKRSALRPLC